MEDIPGDTSGYQQLGTLADTLLEECDDDVALLAERIDRLPPPERDGLVGSDFLNAYQVFYYFFRVEPGEVERERLILIPGSELQYGIRINEIELFELIVAVVDKKPIVVVSDGDRILARYSGRNAYTAAQEYITSAL